MNVLKDPKGPFYTAYLDKGRLSSFISNIPIYLVKVEDLGERGAQYVAAKLLMDVNVEEEHKNISSIPVISTEKNNLLSSLSVMSLNVGLLLGLGIAFAFTQLKSKKWK